MRKYGKEYTPKNKYDSSASTNRYEEHIEALRAGKLKIISSAQKKNVKLYFLNKQNHRCSICHNVDDVWQGNKIVFVLDHIDGNCLNDVESNLRLVCPNCDSQLPTFKRRNKNGSAYNREYERKHKRKTTGMDEETLLKSAAPQTGPEFDSPVFRHL